MARCPWRLVPESLHLRCPAGGNSRRQTTCATLSRSCLRRRVSSRHARPDVHSMESEMIQQRAVGCPFPLRRLMLLAVAVATASVTLSAQHYRTDRKYTPTSLAGWHVLGDAAWRVENGEYVGTPKNPRRGVVGLRHSV